RAKIRNLLLAHLVGHDEDALVAAYGCKEREGGAGVAARRLDDGSARFKAALFGASKDVGGEPILVASSRIQELALDVNFCLDRLGYAVEADDRRIADGFGDVLEGSVHHGTM